MANNQNNRQGNRGFTKEQQRKGGRNSGASRASSSRKNSGMKE